MTVGSIINVAVLPYCELVVLSTVGVLGILINNALSVIFLGEKMIWRYDLPAILLILTGCLTVVLLSDYSSEKYTPDRIVDLLLSTPTIVFFSVTFVFVIFTIVQYCWHIKMLANFNAKANNFLQQKIEEMLSA